MRDQLENYSQLERVMKTLIKLKQVPMAISQQPLEPVRL